MSKDEERYQRHLSRLSEDERKVVEKFPREFELYGETYIFSGLSRNVETVYPRYLPKRLVEEQEKKNAENLTGKKE